MLALLPDLDFLNSSTINEAAQALPKNPAVQDVSATARSLWNTARHLLERALSGGVSSAPLPEAAVKQLCETAQDILAQEGNVQNVDAPVTIIGDIHGQYTDLLEIFEVMGRVPETSYVFLGDYVDRGHHSVETIQLLLALKVRFPSQVTLLRGNHECRAVAQVFGFYDEVSFKYRSSNVWHYYMDLFDYLPLGCVIDGKVFCTHGGLTPSLNTLDELSKLDRVQEIPHDGPICDLLWSDPSDESGWGLSARGAGFLFGPDVTERFVHENGLHMLCRAHQLVMDGYSWTHNNQVVTVFSAPNYCGRVANKGAVMTVSRHLEFGIRQFDGYSYHAAGDVESQMLDAWVHSGSVQEAPSPRSNIASL